MINLLAYDKKSEIRAGRANVIVLNYIVMSLVAIFLLVLIVAGSYYTLNLTRVGAQDRVDQNASLTSSYNATEKQAAEFRSNLAVAKQILDSEVSYSPLLVKIAQAVPSGVILDGLTLDEKTIGSATTIAAHAKDKNAALALKTNFEKQKDLFSNVHFDSLSTADSAVGGGTDGYPVAISLSIIINKAALK